MSPLDDLREPFGSKPLSGERQDYALAEPKSEAVHLMHQRVNVA